MVKCSVLVFRRALLLQLQLTDICWVSLEILIPYIYRLLNWYRENTGSINYLETQTAECYLAFLLA